MRPRRTRRPCPSRGHRPAREGRTPGGTDPHKGTGPGRDRAAQGGGPREGAGPTTRERPHDGERPQEVERLHGGERPREVAGPTMNALRAGWSPRGAGRHQGAGRTKAQPAATAARTTAQPAPDRRASAARTRPQPARPPDHSPPDDPAPTGPQPTRQPSPHQATSHTRPQVTQGFPCASAQVAACGPATPGASGREHHLRSLYARTTGRGDARGGCMRIRSRNGQRA